MKHSKSLVIVDGEGISEIEDHHECWPCFLAYWRTGRKKFTSDTIAAAQGLLDAGISEVVVLDGHGTGAWRNLLEDRLPRNVRKLNENEDTPESFDSWFYVGAHARCGTPDGFVSHTHVPYFRVAIGDSLITETHQATLWMGKIPLGVTGDATMDSQLDSFLQGVPFLPVKRSSNRFTTTRLFPTAESSFGAIRSFTRACANAAKGRRNSPIRLKPFEINFSFDPRVVKRLNGKNGLVRKSRSVLTLRAKSWTKEVQTIYDSVVVTGMETFLRMWNELDLSSEKAVHAQKKDSLKKVQDYFEKWVHANISPWRI
jgi:D-aminopeptidase